MSATIALCIPAYNAAWCLPRLLKSARAQQIPFNEILVYNDYSTDNTSEIAQNFGAKVIEGQVNKGCSGGKNAMAQVVTSDWIHFHDADDELLPNFTSLCHQWISKNKEQYEVLILNYRYIDYDTQQTLGLGNYNKKEMNSDSLKYAIENKIVNFGLYHTPAFLAVGGFDTDKNVLYNEDKAFHIRLAGRFDFDYLAEVTCLNYHYTKSMSQSNLWECAHANYCVLKKTADLYGDLYPQSISLELLKCATHLASLQDWETTKKAISLSRLLYPEAKVSGSSYFKLLAGIDKYMAYWVREKLIRTFKPEFRK